MKPRPLTILLLLVAGAVVNVGVAWGFAVSRNITDREDEFRIVHHADRHWFFQRTYEPGSALIEGAGPPAGPDSNLRSWREFIAREQPVVVAIDALPRWSGLTEPPQSLEPPYLQPVRADVARGWPFLAVSCRMDAVLEGDLLHKPRIEGGIRVGEFPRGTVLAERVLPYCPLWPGFAINTLFYAALLWLLFLFAPRQTRHLIRARRGLCPACGYPVGETAVCGECGKSVNAVSTSTTAE